MTVYNRKNFHKHTYCVFTEVPFQAMDRKPDFTSKSGSCYYYSDEGVLRISNHWGRAAKCKWKLKPLPDTTGRTKAGFAKWTSFHHDNETERLYFLQFDLFEKVVDYAHRDSADSPGAFLRTASDTTRRIKEVRHILNDERWLDYYEHQHREEIQTALLQQLVQTNEPLAKLKAAIHQQYNS
ncbi:MAG TPA: hypothetical protein VFQ50_01170 [Flavobacterium sp.]|nr:hypothetical protein [Flavobacterium sp.]